MAISIYNYVINMRLYVLFVIIYVHQSTTMMVLILYRWIYQFAWSEQFGTTRIFRGLENIY